MAILEMLVFVDETGADRRNCLRRFEYSLRGKPAVSKKLLVHGQRVLAIAAMSTEGILDCYTVTGSVSGSQFSDFVQQALLPQLQPFNGVHECSQCGDTRQCFYPPRRWYGGSYWSTGVLSPPPPHSPDLNAIEEAFSKLKITLRAIEALLDILDVGITCMHALQLLHKIVKTG